MRLGELLKKDEKYRLARLRGNYFLAAEIAVEICVREWCVIEKRCMIENVSEDMANLIEELTDGVLYRHPERDLRYFLRTYGGYLPEYLRREYAERLTDEPTD